MALPHLADQVGRVLDGRYRVVAPIGTGASAAVFLADDVTLRRRVAIKVLHAALAGDQSFLKRFQAEAHTAAGLSHPNVMRVLDWGEADDGPFLVLEYLGGGSLRAVLDDSGTLTVEQAVAIGLQAARALEYAHRRGLVHRDIKPANLLFDEERRLAIADFGLARALAEAAWTEPGGAVLGTARYASPEQVRGQSLNGKADVYAMGLVLIEAVCGYVPFTADTTIATLMARLDVQLEAPAEMGPLGEIVERATNPDPAQRIDASQLVAQLEAAASSLPQPEQLNLPGAVAFDVISVDGVDATMLPGQVNRRSQVENNVPLVPEPLMKRTGVLRRKREVPQATMAELEVKQPRRKMPLPSAKKTFLVLLIVLLLGGGGSAAYALYFFTGKQVPVPELQGTTLDQARAAAKAADIKLSYDGQDFSETVPNGETFEQSPAAGGKVHEREAVHLKVSKGPAPRDVTDETGKTLAEANQLFASKGLVVTTKSEFNESVAKNVVLKQDPSNGQLARGATVTLTISGGPAPRPIPDVTGQTYDAAVAALTAQQLTVTRTDGFSDTVAVGLVAGTTPGPGTAVDRGTSVAIIVSKGPDTVPVTDVRGRSISSATSTLQANGFVVVNIYGPASGTVFATDPATGTKAKRGSNVSLYTR